MVYSEQDSEQEINIANTEKCSKKNWTKKNGWTGPKPTFLAGIYSIWQPDEDSPPLYTFTIITR